MLSSFSPLKIGLPITCLYCPPLNICSQAISKSLIHNCEISTTFHNLTVMKIVTIQSIRHFSFLITGESFIYVYLYVYINFVYELYLIREEFVQFWCFAFSLWFEFNLDRQKDIEELLLCLCLLVYNVGPKPKRENRYNYATLQFEFRYNYPRCKSFVLNFTHTQSDTDKNIT